MRRHIGLLVIALLATLAPSVEGQQGIDPTEMSLTDLMATPVDDVYGASKFLQRVTDAPASVTIITAEEIRLFGYRTLADVLRSVAGISMSYDRNYTYLGMRGLSRPGDLNTRVLVMINGHRMNNNVDDQAAMGTDFQLDVDLIDHLEVIRGPSAALYGSTAFAAVIAVITKSGHDFDGAEGAVSGASYDTTRARLTWGKRYAKGRELFVSGSTYRTKGQSHLFFPSFDTPGNNGGIADHADGDRADTVSLSATLGDFTFLGLYSARTKQVPTASFDTVFNSALERTFDGRTALDVQYTKELRQSINVLARIYGDRYSYDGDYPYASPDADDSTLVINRDHFEGHWWGGEFDVSGRVRRAHRLTVGVEYRQNRKQSTLNYDENPYTLYIDHDPRSSTFALNLQDEYTIGRHVLLNLAGRQERTTTGDIGFRPKLGLILTPRSDSTIKFLFSRAARSPSAYELHYDSPGNAGNTGLRAETIDALELNAEHYLTPAMKVEGSVFHNTYHNLIVGVADEAGVVSLVNGLNARANGLEASGTIKLRGKLLARASYSTLFNADVAANAWTSGAPAHLAKVNLGYWVVPLQITVAGEMQYQSRRHAHDGSVLEPALVANINVVKARALRDVDFNISVLNLFATRYSDPVSESHLPGSILQDGRQLVVGLNWRLK